MRNNSLKIVSLFLVIALLFSACAPAGLPTAPAPVSESVSETPPVKEPETSSDGPSAAEPESSSGTSSGEEPPPGQTAGPTEGPSTSAVLKAPSFSSWLQSTNGVSVLRGTGAPSAGLGDTADSYTDMENLTVYWKESTGWKKMGSLTSSGYYAVRFASTAEAELPEPLIVKRGTKIAEPPVPSVPGAHFEGWYSEGCGGKWKFDEDSVTGSLTLTAVYTDPVPRAATALTNRDTAKTSAELNGVNAAVVIFLSYTDGFVCDREAFEASFEAELSPEGALESLSTYYRLNSYGKVSFDFYFSYYDTGMTCKEAFAYTDNDDSAVSMLYDSFYDFRDHYEGDPHDLDRNGDGYVDMIFFIGGEDPLKTVGDGRGYYIFGAGAAPTESFPPDPDKPSIHSYAKLAYDTMLTPLAPGKDAGGLRNLIHETGHIFGLVDYYNSGAFGNEPYFDTLGCFDMQSHDYGDWNVFSRFSCGWLEPYVIDGTQEKVTLKLGCSSEVPDAVLIPSGKGWNGTAFDEYILIDVLAPYAANAYDWPYLCVERFLEPNDARRGGGVRVYHVDARQVRAEISSSAHYSPADTYEDLLGTIREEEFRHSVWLWNRFTNSDRHDPYFSEAERGMHLIEVIPSDGSARFQGRDVIMPWRRGDQLRVNDLFSPGMVFSTETCFAAFRNAPLMNSGAAFDYEVKVNFFDPEAREAVITVTRIR